MSIDHTILAKIMSRRYRALFRMLAVCILLAGVTPVAVVAADEPTDAEELRQAVRDLREQVGILRNEVRKLAAAKSVEQAVDDDGGTNSSPSSGGGNGGSASPGKAGSAQTPSAASRNRPSTARRRRHVPERQPYYVYPPAWYGWPYYYTPGYGYPYDYHLYYYGVPFYPNSVIVNPYKGLWFNP